MNDIKFLAKANMWPIYTKQDKNNFTVKVGDLLSVGYRLCLVIDIQDEESSRNVLIKWIGDDENYWIKYETLIAITQTKKWDNYDANW